MENYFRGVATRPFHLSVGAVLINDKGDVACNYTTHYRGAYKVWRLMTETIEPGETIEQAVSRGLLEEFGAKAQLEGYVGSLQSIFQRGRAGIYKTVIYFACRLEEQNDEWMDPADDTERLTTLRWVHPDFLVSKARTQTQDYGLADESTIIENAIRIHNASQP